MTDSLDSLDPHTLEARKLGRFFSLSVDLLCTANFDGYFERLNPVWETTLGYSTAELMSKPFVEFIHPDDVAATVAEVEKVSAGATTIAFQNRYRAKDGTYRWFQWTAVPDFNEGLIYAVARDVTPERATREALRQTTAFQHAILESSNYSIISTDTEGTILTFNAAAERMFGYSAEEIVGHATPAILHDSEEVKRRAGELSRELGKPVSPGFETFVVKARAAESDEHEWTYIRKDGSRFPAMVSVSALRDEAGALIGFVGLGREITRRVRAEEDLSKFFALVENSQDFIGMASLDGDVQFVNDAGRRLVGLAPDDDVSHIRWQDFVIPEHRDAIRLEAMPAMVRDGHWMGELQLRHFESGETIDVEASGLLVRHPETGVPLCLATVQRDVTARKRAERAQARLISILQTTTDMVGMFDTDGRNTFANQAWRRLMGVNADVDLSDRHFHPEWARTLLFEEGLPSASKHGVWTGETAVLTAEGREIPVSQVVLSHKNEAGSVEYFSTVARDISTQKEVDRMKSEFVATVSHELRTPLTSIRGSIGLLEGGVAGPMPAEAQELLGIARQNCDRLIRMINDILDLEKIEAGQLDLRFETVDVEDLVDKSLESLAPMAAEAGIRLERTLDQPGAVLGDQDRLIQVLTNLVANAVKFSPSESRVEVHARRVDAGVRISIQDHGPGIPAEQLHRLFVRFEQLDSSDSRATGGTGLGLAISKGIVDEHHGTITVDTELGHGSTFVVTLPAVEGRD